MSWKERVCHSINLIELARDTKMEDATLIGHVSRQTKEAKWHIRLKSVQFSWQRGVKIGKLVMNMSRILTLARRCASVLFVIDRESKARGDGFLIETTGKE